MAKPSGEIYLLKNVPLVASYEHTIDFKDKAEQFTYFQSFIKKTLLDYTYIRKEREYIVVGLSLEELDDVNYLMFKSIKDGRLYFAFVTSKKYENPNTTTIFFDVDVMQTYMFDYEFKASYIQRAHVDRWDANHKPIYSKTDEGLAYGSEYSVESGFKIQQSSAVKWLLISFVSLNELPGQSEPLHVAQMNPAPSPFYTLLVPLVAKTTQDQYSDNYTVINGDGDVIIPDYQDFIRVMSASAIGQNIRSISLMTYNPFVLSEIVDNTAHTVQVFLDTANNEFYTKSFIYGDDVESKGFIVIESAHAEYMKNNRVLSRAEWNIGLEDTLPTLAEWEEAKANPYTTKRDKRFESKLLCAPYRYNILTDWRNQPIIYKNEYLPTDKIEVRFTYAMSYNAPFRFWLKDYKSDPLGRYTTLTQPIALEFPVINDAYHTYMLQNKNTIQTNVANAVINAGMGVIGGASVGGLVGALSGTAKGIVNVGQGILTENAKQQDLKVVPDTVVNSTDSAFNVIDDSTDINFYRMRICCENELILAEIFNMTGYKVNSVAVPNLRSRTRFNYIQTLGANIVGSFNQEDILKLKEIFDKGVTIWHYNEKHFNMLDYTLENLEVNLL